ncbi:hypothetical protein AA313_de0201430 [Arthrobotrys entomopaga]|nr:hypothetical protein AA313_de0201430 [Arthrobotrys entomopaga]
MENTHQNKSDVPHLSLAMKADPWLSTTLPYYIDVAIRREDSDDRSCIFRWSPHIDGFSTPGFQILHHGTDGSTKKIEVDHSGLMEKDETLLVNGRNQFLWELKPGAEINLKTTLPENYHRCLMPGNRYEVVWPGAKIALWDWGTIRDHLNKELKPRSLLPEGEPILTIPEGSQISLTVKKEAIRWPDREVSEKRNGFMMANLQEQQWRLQKQSLRGVSPPPIDPSERIPGAPIIRVELECPSTVTRNEVFDVVVKVTYDGIANIHEQQQVARPVTFHTYAFEALNGPREGFRLKRRSKVDSTEWEPCELDDGTGFMIADEPDVSVHVGEDENFVTLEPGHSWTTPRRLQGERWTSLPAGVVVGDIFRCRFKGTTVDWWDWGSRDEHINTVVKLPCWITGKVTDPAHNEGRPELLVPASDVVEFTVVG